MELLQNIAIFCVSLALIIKGAAMATKYSVKLASNYNFSKYIVGFAVVAFISILPETAISINAALEGIPEFGLGTLFGSNIADLSLIFAILIFYAGRGIKIETKVLKNVSLYPFFLSLPILFGLNGHYSRIEGTALILAGALFYYLVFRSQKNPDEKPPNASGKYKNMLFLIVSMALLLVGAHFIVTSASDIARAFNVSPILIGMIFVSLGTTMPELFYSLKVVKSQEDGLAIGDILGSVLADATIVVGLLAFISPFYFPIKTIYVTGVCMVAASIVLLKFMRSGKIISRKEGLGLFLLWIAYVAVEFYLSK